MRRDECACMHSSNLGDLITSHKSQANKFGNSQGRETAHKERATAKKGEATIWQSTNGYMVLVCM